MPCEAIGAEWERGPGDAAGRAGMRDDADRDRVTGELSYSVLHRDLSTSPGTCV